MVTAYLQQMQAHTKVQIKLHVLYYNKQQLFCLRLNYTTALGPEQWSSADFTSQK